MLVWSALSFSGAVINHSPPIFSKRTTVSFERRAIIVAFAESTSRYRSTSS